MVEEFFSTFCIDSLVIDVLIVVLSILTTNVKLMQGWIFFIFVYQLPSSSQIFISFYVGIFHISVFLQGIDIFFNFFFGLVEMMVDIIEDLPHWSLYNMFIVMIHVLFIQKIEKILVFFVEVYVISTMQRTFVLLKIIIEGIWLLCRPLISYIIRTIHHGLILFILQNMFILDLYYLMLDFLMVRA